MSFASVVDELESPEWKFESSECVIGRFITNACITFLSCLHGRF